MSSLTLRTLDQLLVPASDDAISLIHEWLKKGQKSIAFHEECNADEEDSFYPGVSHRLVMVKDDSITSKSSNNKSSSNNNDSDENNNTSEDGARELVKLQVTTKSPLGAFAYHCRILFAYNGMIRVLGAGQNVYTDEGDLKEKPQIRSVSSWTAHCHHSSFLPRGAMIVADDIFGGVFALNGGGLKNCEIGRVCYLAPDSFDSKDWEDMELSYTAFFSEWLMDAQRVYLWYSSWLFKDFFSIIKEKPNNAFDERSDRAFSFYPPLWSKEATTAEITMLSRKVVPVEEIWAMRHTPFSNTVQDQREKDELIKEEKEKLKKQMKAAGTDDNAGAKAVEQVKTNGGDQKAAVSSNGQDDESKKAEKPNYKMMTSSEEVD